jgi:hypothetical protein
MSDWILDSGTAGLFDLLRQNTSLKIAFDAQRPGDYQSILRGRIFEQALIPKSPRAEFL